MGEKRQKKLVISHLESVSGDVFEHYPAVIEELIKGKSGVYALYRNDTLYYVGLASNLMSRLKAHLRDRHKRKWNRFSVYLTVHDDHMKELESLMLRVVKPKGNRRSGKFMASNPLRRELNSLIKSYDADRRARLLGGTHTNRRIRAKAAKPGKNILANIFDRRVRLLGWHNGREFKATLRRDGRISYCGDLYLSPSGAGKAARGRSTNGWAFWHFRKDSEWIPINSLKR
jgi:predicted GIY-YIG superfamily endonuclease